MSSGTNERKTSTENPSMSRTFHWRVTCVCTLVINECLVQFLILCEKISNKETLLLFPRVLELTAVFVSLQENKLKWLIVLWFSVINNCTFRVEVFVLRQ